MLKAKVIVQLKKEVSDSEGFAVNDALNTIQPNLCRQVRVGKTYYVDLQTEDRDMAEAGILKVCQDILANPVIEEYSYEIYSE